MSSRRENRTGVRISAEALALLRADVRGRRATIKARPGYMRGQ